MVIRVNEAILLNIKVSMPWRNYALPLKWQVKKNTPITRPIHQTFQNDAFRKYCHMIQKKKNNE